jgi:hypothetical protein
MTETQPPETDLIVPLSAEGEGWNPHTIHTHFLGFCVPEATLGVYTYIRYQPHFPLCQGGVLVFQGLDNLAATDMAFLDYQMTMPWPKIEGDSFETPNGLRYEFAEPGRRVVISYRSSEGDTSIDVEATAATPLAARGHVAPDEELYKRETSGGSEQFMHYVGEIVVNGERHPVDCHYPRDRSWRQVRKEHRDANAHPPISWTPIYIDDALAFSQVGIESPDTDPQWGEGFEIPGGSPNHHFAWVCRNGELRGVTRVRRDVTRTHPFLSAPLEMEIEAEDTAGESYRFSGEAIAFSPIPTWPNAASFDSVFRWEDENGRIAHGPVQTLWGERAARALKAKRGPAAIGLPSA